MSAAVVEELEAPLARLRFRVVRRLARQPVAVGSGIVLAAILVAGALAQTLASAGWNAIDLDPRWRNHGPTLAAHHFFGTDLIGRDVLQRLLWGIHYSEQTAILGGLAATLVALVAGITAGYAGGWLEAAVMRSADLVSGFPVIVILIVAFEWLRPVTIWDATAIFAVVMWPFAARVFRARAVSLRTEEYLDAARALGASAPRIVVRHVVPNAAGAIAVSATSLIGQILLIEATVEFFGFGVSATTRPTLGNLIGESTQGGLGSYNALGLGWWAWTSPMVALALLLLCVNLVGDGLDAALNPRSSRA